LHIFGKQDRLCTEGYIAEGVQPDAVSGKGLKEMNTPICPTCGCSLVRLKIGKDESVSYHHDGEEHRFCCQGCVDVFAGDPEKYLREVSDLVVCPVCLGEKTPESTVELEHAGTTLHFCRCPHCTEEFQKYPEYYMNRLAG
jgi:YHS domain-containing protein